MKRLTKIKKLELKGFKSFARKSEIVFGEKFNCILGPNGAGKSNVLDAICFVLGKASAKGMRADKSANLIYSGGKNKEPAKEGIVSIYFDNVSKVFGEGIEEFVITRIVKSNGVSVYKMNGKSVSRQEILDVLAKARINPDGYNIILQGDIVRLTEMTPLERRSILEEIAGISVYEDKKTKALNELDKVESSLKEADIILTERGTYLKELSKERNQAMKFKQLNENIKRNKKTLVVNRINEKKSLLEELEKKIKEHQTNIDSLKKKISIIDKDIQNFNSKIEGINREIEEKGEKEQIEVHKSVETLRVQFALKKQRLETVEQEIEKLKQRISGLEKTKSEIDAKLKINEKENHDANSSLKIKEKELVMLNEKITEFRKKHSMEDASKSEERIAAIDNEADKIQEDIAKLREEQQGLLREKDRIEIFISNIDERINRVLSVKRENQKMLEEFKSKKEQLNKSAKELEIAVNENVSIVSEITTIKGKISSLNEQLSSLNAQNSIIKEGIAGGVAVKKVLDMNKEGVYGTIASLGVVQENYAIALETAAGQRLSSIVVDTDKTAAECINFLKKNKYGVATFIPLNKIKPPEEKHIPDINKNSSVIGFASELVKYNPQFKKAFDYVFGNTLVVENIESARKIGIGNIRMVTLTGDLIERSGLMQGGFRERAKGIGFRQKELDDKLNTINKNLEDANRVLATLEQKRKDNEQLIEKLRIMKANLEGDIIKIEKLLHIDSETVEATERDRNTYKKELESINKKIDSITNKISDLTSKLASLKSEKQNLRDSLTKMRSPVVLAQLNSLEEKKREVQEEINKILTKISVTNSEINNILTPEIENISKILKQHEKESADFMKEKNILSKEIAKNQSDLKEKEEIEKKFFSSFKNLFNERTKLGDRLKELESEKSTTLIKITEIEGKSNNISLDIARLKGELAGLEEEMSQFEDVEPFKDKVEEQILKEIKQFEKLAEELGAVNMKALEVFESVEKEYKSLEKKKEKLSKEKEDILLMINKIETKKRELFMKSFEIMNENFQKFFSTLLNKGQANLVLETPEDPFQGGLTIKVKITGKKFLDIRGLSGGEKTLTALAFLFAVQEYEPANFYILDEIDAALDKHNSERLAKLIRSYCDNAQYIIISHNDSLLSEADNLYGISMDADGVSKITSIKL